MRCVTLRFQFFVGFNQIENYIILTRNNKQRAVVVRHDSGGVSRESKHPF